jgi:hypothetical protein
MAEMPGFPGTLAHFPLQKFRQCRDRFSLNHNYLLLITTMVSMDLPTAVKSYQFGERAKSELIVTSQLCIALSGFSEQERAGGKRMLLLLMESVRSELQFAVRSTGQQEFQRAINALNEAISLVESNQPDMATEKIAFAISASTTSAQEAWQVLSEHGLL